MLQVAIVDDHPLFREAMINVLTEVAPDCQCYEAATIEEALGRARASPPLDLILLDLGMPGVQGMSGLDRLRQEQPETPIVVVSAAVERATVMLAIERGAAGYLSKSSRRQSMVTALREVLAGAVYLPADIVRGSGAGAAPLADQPVRIVPGDLAQLSPKQLKVLERLARGESNKEIAKALGLSEPTVKAHISALLRKLKLRSRSQVIVAMAAVDFRNLNAKL